MFENISKDDNTFIMMLCLFNCTIEDTKRLYSILTSLNHKLTEAKKKIKDKEEVINSYNHLLSREEEKNKALTAKLEKVETGLLSK